MKLTEQEKADNVYLWLANTKRDYDRILTAIGNSVASGVDNAKTVAECAAEMLYRQYYCGQRTGDNVYYTLPRIEAAVRQIMDL